jgi:hypothetical protein
MTSDETKATDGQESFGRRMLKFIRVFDYIHEFERETDRGFAILAICVLEDFLVASINWRLGELGDKFERPLAPRGRMSVTINSCGLLGILSLDEMADLHRLVRIRNDFAHKLTKILTFDDPQIKNELRQLKILDRAISSKTELSARDRFYFSMAAVQFNCTRRFVLMERMSYALEFPASESPEILET